MPPIARRALLIVLALALPARADEPPFDWSFSSCAWQEGDSLTLTSP